ncbi:lipase [Mycena galericulata]|nr:lipase [Mycena galericulata]
MHSSSLTRCFLALALFASTSFASPVLLSPREISSALYDDFVLYTKYSSAAYQPFCRSPVGSTLVRSFERGRTQGFIARDSDREEIIVAFRGTFSLKDAVIDALVFLAPFVSPGITELVNVHTGFLKAYNNVVDDVLSIVKAELTNNPTYRVVVTGHSLGGAIASLAAPSLKIALPDAAIKLYTFGQPRVGDARYARFVENTIGIENIFRSASTLILSSCSNLPSTVAVHTFGKSRSSPPPAFLSLTAFSLVLTLDGVPTMVPRIWKYEHFATEYWQFRDPTPLTPRESTVRQCVGGEDPTCSDSIFSTGINPAHTFYFGQLMATNPFLCRSQSTNDSVAAPSEAVPSDAVPWTEEE